MFKVCAIIGLSKTEFFYFSGTDRVKWALWSSSKTTEEQYGLFKALGIHIERTKTIFSAREKFFYLPNSEETGP